ncbi:hypothetical protein IAU60_002618 [Kwoniella sp. DSM 27419]
MDNTPRGSVPGKTAESTPSAPLPNPLEPGTFRSILPLVNDILATLYAQSASAERITPAQAGEQVAGKAKELAQALEGMKTAALQLPGGHITTEQVRKLQQVMTEEGDKRRRILETFDQHGMPSTDRLCRQHMTDGDAAAGSVMPSPIQQ